MLSPSSRFLRPALSNHGRVTRRGVAGITTTAKHQHPVPGPRSFPSPSSDLQIQPEPYPHQLRMMPLGGSVTMGVGSSDGNGYRQELLKLLREKDYDVQMLGSRKTGNMADEDSYHEGWRGFRLDQIAKKAKYAVRTLNPNVFLINAGSNDCIQGNHLESIGRRMEELMLNRLWKAFPGSLVILSTLVRNQNPGVEAKVLWANGAYERLVERLAKQQKRIVLADMHDWYKGPELEFDVAADGTHPNDKGYSKMARIWMAAIEEARGKYLLPMS